MLIQERVDNSLTNGGNPLKSLEISMSLKEIGLILQKRSVIELIGAFDEVIQIKVKLFDDTTTTIS